MLKNKSMSAGEISELLEKAPVGYLGLAKAGIPYVIPINFVYSDQIFYFHCAPEGRKVDYINANRRACFHSGEIGGLVAAKSPCKHSYSYRSVIAEGTMDEVVEAAEKEAVLHKITAKYAGPVQAKLPMAAKNIGAVKVYRLVPDHISGKRNP